MGYSQQLIEGDVDSINLAIYRGDLDPNGLIEVERVIDGVYRTGKVRPLAIPIVNKDIAMIAMLLNNGADPTLAVEEDVHHSSLSLAIYTKARDIVRRILLTKPDLDKEDTVGVVPLGLAITIGDFDIADMLLEAGASLDHYSTNMPHDCLYEYLRGSNKDKPDTLRYIEDAFLDYCKNLYSISPQLLIEAKDKTSVTYAKRQYLITKGNKVIINIKTGLPAYASEELAISLNAEIKELENLTFLKGKINVIS